MPGRPDRLGEFVAREGLRDGGIGFADDRRQLILHIGVIVHELFERLDLLDRIEILAQEVLHQGDLGVVAAFDEDAGNVREARCLQCFKYPRRPLTLAGGQSARDEDQ